MILTLSTGWRRILENIIILTKLEKRCVNPNILEILNIIKSFKAHLVLSYSHTHSFHLHDHSRPFIPINYIYQYLQTLYRRSSTSSRFHITGQAQVHPCIKLVSLQSYYYKYLLNIIADLQFLDPFRYFIYLQFVEEISYHSSPFIESSIITST